MFDSESIGIYLQEMTKMDVKWWLHSGFVGSLHSLDASLFYLVSSV